MYAATMPATIWMTKRRTPRTIVMAPIRTMPTVTWEYQRLPEVLEDACMKDFHRTLVPHSWVEEASADSEEDPCVDG